jgi:hypothetical protein
MQNINEVLREEIRALQIELLCGRVLSMIGPALRKAEQRSGVVLSETVSDHLDVIAEEVSRVAELCIGQNRETMSTAKSTAPHRRKAGLLARQSKNTATQVHPIESQQFIAGLSSQGAVLWLPGDSLVRTATSSLRNSK